MREFRESMVRTSVQGRTSRTVRTIQHRPRLTLHQPSNTVTKVKGRNLPLGIRPFRDKVERALTGWNSWKGKSISVQDARYSAHVEKLIG